jgi:hypothetical protein
VLEVRARRRERAGDRRIERPAHRGEEQNRSDSRPDLEASVGDVLVRHPIPREVKNQAERQRAQPRADEGTAGRPCRDVKRDDHATTLPASLTLRGKPRIL